MQQYVENTKKGLIILEGLHKQFPFHLQIKIDLIHAYIKLGYHQQAIELINTLPDNLGNRLYPELKSWVAYQQGHVEIAKDIYRIVTKKHIIGALALEKIKELIYRSSHEINIKPDDILLFSVEYNELLRLPSLLNHYRKLGIKHFFFIDNNSTDGSLEFLLSQPDCYVFWTNHSFYEAQMGMAWINALIHQYATEGQWCIHPDADELMVYPNMETCNLIHLVRYLDEQGYEIISSYMLDMYPATKEQQLAFKPEDDMLVSAPYFYNDYVFFHQIYCPYNFPVGGIFNYLDTNPGTFTKTSLFKFSRDFYFINSTHSSTPCKVADISSAYLHFKMLGDFKVKAITETKRKEHWAGGINYKKYASIYERDDINDLSKLDKSVKYKNSQQLVELGLIQTSLAWDCYSNVNSG